MLKPPACLSQIGPEILALSNKLKSIYVIWEDMNLSYTLLCFWTKIFSGRFSHPVWIIAPALKLLCTVISITEWNFISGWSYTMCNWCLCPMLFLVIAKERNQELEVEVKREKDQRNETKQRRKEKKVEIETKRMIKTRTGVNRYFVHVDFQLSSTHALCTSERNPTAKKIWLFNSYEIFW